MTFVDNKYTACYDRLIARATGREKLPGVLYELHHVIPRSLGGADEVSNLVALTIREHYIAHLLLTKMVARKDHLIKMSWALHRMCFSRSTSRSYESNRKRWSSFMKDVFHPQRNLDLDYRERLSASVEKSWENDVERRHRLSEKMKLYNETRKSKDFEAYLQEQRKRSKAGAAKSKEIVTKKIAYEGREFLGWKELEDETGISRYLYNKFYRHGINPSFRVGKDGPMDTEDVKQVVTQYCYMINESYPLTKEDALIVCERARAVGLLTKQQAEAFIINNFR